MPVRHQLLGVKGATLKDIKTVESHVHALGQCRKVIRKLGIKPIVAADTAGSAREIAEAGDKTRASIASRLAAEIYGLDILAEDIEDEAHNTTRFIVLSRESKWAKSGAGPVITTFLFRVRNVPAALYKALGGFATNGVNMTKLESYMIEGNFLATQFYADVEGHPEDRNVVFAFEELAFYSKEMKILGVYPAHPFRITMNGARTNRRIGVPGSAPVIAGLVPAISLRMARAAPMNRDGRDKPGHNGSEIAASQETQFPATCASGERVITLTIASQPAGNLTGAWIFTGAGGSNRSSLPAGGRP